MRPLTGNYTRILVFALFAVAGSPALAQPSPYTDMTRLSPYVPDVKVITEEIWGLSQLPFHAPARGIFALCHGMFQDVGIGPKDLAQKIGLSQTEVIAAAEARLRSARLYRDAGDQALSVSVNLGEDVFSVEVALKRAVRDLGYTIGGVMTVWETGYIGSYSSSEIILSALSRRKVVHQDIKPDNIFVASDGHLVLGDCGLAFGLEHETRQTRPFENVGSRDFQPPWSYTTRLAEVHPTFDVFCLAKVLWAMVSGRPTFRLWYFDEDGNDLREMFPDDPAMEFVQEILRKCVVEREREMKVHDARELLAEVDTAIAALSHGCELPGRERIMRCRFCGIGTYETLEGHLVAGGLLRTEYERTYVVCDHCGHVEMFAWPEGKPPPVWDVSE